MLLSGVVKKSARCSSDSTWVITTSSLKISSRKKWGRTSMYFEFDVQTGIYARCLAPSVSSNTVINRGPNPRKTNIQTKRRNIASFIVSASATYSAWVVENVTHFCVLEKQHTHAPAHTIPRPATDLLSVA